MSVFNDSLYSDIFLPCLVVWLMVLFYKLTADLQGQQTDRTYINDIINNFTMIPWVSLVLYKTIIAVSTFREKHLRFATGIVNLSSFDVCMLSKSNVV